MDELWIEVFKAGVWTGSDGKTRTWTGEDLDRIVAATRARLAGDGVPAVIGHPETTAPAWGWVSEIKREGESLFVRFASLVPEFVDMVRRRLFPHRSVAIASDFSLQHVGFLGARPPAVKGLAPIALSTAPPLAVIDFTAPAAQEDTRMTFVEKLKQFLGLSEELGIPVTLPAAAKPADPSPGPKTFSEADVQAAAAAAAEKARTDERTKLERGHAATTRRASIVTFCDGLKKDGHLLPAWEKAGLIIFMGQLAERDELVTFAEGGDKQTALAWFQAFLGGLPKLVEFREVAPATKPATTQLSDTQRAINRQMGVPDEVVTKFTSRN